MRILSGLAKSRFYLDLQDIFYTAYIAACAVDSIPNLALFFDNLEKKLERSQFQLIMTGMGVTYHQKKK